MKGLVGVGRRPSPAVLIAAVAVVFASAGLVAGANLQPPKEFTPNSENQITNIDVLRSDIKNYYGTHGASTGAGTSSAPGGWSLDLVTDSPYAKEANAVAADAWAYLKTKVGKYEMPAIVFDVDDTTLTTYNYELYSNWDYNPSTNSIFVGLTGSTWTGNLFPSTPGMYDLLWKLDNAGYAIFFITGRPDSQHQVTIANLLDDAAAGLATISTVYHTLTGLPIDMDEVDVQYPAPTAINIGHGVGGIDPADGLFTKPPRPGSSDSATDPYPSYLDTAEFCQSYIDTNTSCPTIRYKSGTRAYIQSQGYHIVADFGDQYSDLLGGYTDTTWKMPNPNYYLP